MPTYPAILAAAGPGGLLATLDSTRLIIRCTETRTLLRNVELDAKFVAQVRHMRWYKDSQQSDAEDPKQRILLATTENVQVYDVRNVKWQANIKKACGEGNKIAAVDFGAHEDEIIAFSAFGMKACLWSLHTGSTTEVRDPKIPSSKAHSLRSQSGHLAVLTRTGVKDVVVVLSPDRKEAEFTYDTPTLDAQGVKWSPDGRWMAVWDTATAGTSVFIYTATGKLFRRFSGGEEDLGYGVQRVEWAPDSCSLIVLLNDGRAVFLDRKTFQPTIVLEYPSRVTSQHAQIYEEQLAADGSRSYSMVKHPIMPPTSENLGFSLATASTSQNYLACVCARTPTTVWIHTFQPEPQLRSVLVHHGAVKQLSWHSSGLLLIHCSEQSSDQSTPSMRPSVYIWGDALEEPRIVSALAANDSIVAAAWLFCTEPRVLARGTRTCSAIAVFGTDDEEEGDEVEFPTPKPHSSQKQLLTVDATPTQILGYDIQTPVSSARSDFSPVKMDTAQLTKTLGFQFTSLSATEDTFDYKRPLRGAV